MKKSPSTISLDSIQSDSLLDKYREHQDTENYDEFFRDVIVTDLENDQIDSCSIRSNTIAGSNLNRWIEQDLEAFDVDMIDDDALSENHDTFLPLCGDMDTNSLPDLIKDTDSDLESLPDLLSIKERRENDHDSISDLDSLIDLDSIPDLDTNSSFDPKTRCNSNLDQYKETDDDVDLDFQSQSLQKGPKLITSADFLSTNQKPSSRDIKSLLDKYKEVDEVAPRTTVVKKPMFENIKLKTLSRAQNSRESLRMKHPLTSNINIQRHSSQPNSLKPPTMPIRATVDRKLIEKKKPTYQVVFGRTVTEKVKPKKPTLIRNVNGSNRAQVIGNMKYDPILKTWKGNEGEVEIFDKPIKKVKPNLIINSGLPDQVGNMFFDPVKLCWTGNESIDDESHLFDHIETFDSSISNVKIILDLYYEFTLEKPTKDIIQKSEVDHKLFMGSWYPRIIADGRMIIRDTSKTHLYEIKTIAELQY